MSFGPRGDASGEGPRVVVGTAGHIDHGKTALLRALTGIDADRLPEERARGMTLDVGYAHLRLDDGDEIDFVDVPGHDRLIGNMLVGAGEIDAALLVVAADDGPRAQTIEHLELLDALAVADGVVAMTKTDLLDDGDDPRAVLVPDEISERLARTSLGGSPIVPVSSVSGVGLAELCAALAALRDRIRGRPEFAAGARRLAIDRAFGIRGRGVVVTGSLRGGSVAAGDMLRLDPGGVRVRVREVQVHGGAVERARGGGRVALNLAGVDLDEVRRGLVLSDGDGIATTDRLLVAVRRLRTTAAGEPLRLHLGTDQVDAAVGRARRETTTLSDGRTTALLRLARPVAVAAGDRFVLRRPSPAETVAGGIVLDPLPPHGIARRRLDPLRLEALATAVDRQGDLAAERLELHGALEVTGGVVLASDVRDAVIAAVLAALREHDGSVPLSDARSLAAREIRRGATLTKEAALRAATAAVDDLVAGSVHRTGDRLLLPGTEPPLDRLAPAMDRLEQALSAAMPPPLHEAAATAACPPAGIRELEAAGRIVRLEDDLAYAASTFREIERLAVGLAATEPLTPARLRDATGTSRRFVMAIIEELDRRGVLQRTPAGHVPGPRAHASG